MGEEKVNADVVIKIRIMNDTKIHQRHWWAEEFIGGHWKEIPSTRMSTESSTRDCVVRHIQEKRDEINRLYIKQVGNELEFKL